MDDNDDVKKNTVSYIKDELNMIVNNMPDLNNIDDSALTDEDYGITDKRYYIDTIGFIPRGNTDAPVTVIIFGDMMSKNLSQNNHVIMHSLDENKDKFKIFFVHIPSSNPRSNAAAIALEAAAKQNKFWKMYDVMMSDFGKADYLEDKKNSKICQIHRSES